MAGNTRNSCEHDYGLDWVDNDKLYREVERAFARLLGIASSSRQELPPDPFLIVAQALVTDTTFQDGLAFEEIRKVNKSLSNALGNMHQGILSIAPNWESLGTTGGVLDIRTKPGYIHPVVGKPIVAEVKNRFNTIKSSEEKEVWDKIDQAARLTNSQGYLFQIVPKTAERYDQLWEPSGRSARPSVRCCDGATAYEIVFERKDALRELYDALPAILADVKKTNGIAHTAPLPVVEEMEELYYQVIPF